MRQQNSDTNRSPTKRFPKTAAFKGFGADELIFSKYIFALAGITIHPMKASEVTTSIETIVASRVFHFSVYYSMCY